MQSKYNTDDNYDYGQFSILETKLNNAKLAIGTIPAFFGKAGVYVFGDHESPFTAQTIVYVTNDKEGICEGVTQWPLTSENMVKFGIEKKEQLMREFDLWLHCIPTGFILVAFLCCWLQNVIEMRIERAEIERRLRREKASATLKKYFKKKQDKFDKVDYLGDMYKLMQVTVDEIKKEIEKNQRRTDEENRDNMNRMLKNKYSVMTDLMKSGGDKDLNIIKQKINSMLTNMRFQDGRSLQQVLDEMKLQKEVEEEEARLKAMQDKEKLEKEMKKSDDSFVSHSFTESEGEDDSFLSKSSKTKSADADAEKEEEQEADPLRANAGLADDLLAHKAALRKKREDFIASIDENLAPAQREALLKNFDEIQTMLAAQIQKEQQD